MRLINDAGAPADVLEVHDVGDNALVGGDQDVELEDVLPPLPVLVLVVHLVLLQDNTIIPLFPICGRISIIDL